jgi:acetylornithine deacetylase/succinyl-diaminopimelate desuccinylase-like protein
VPIFDSGNSCERIAHDDIAMMDPKWSDVLDETVVHLKRLIQLDTTNPPGNEMSVARYLDDVLRAANIETHLFEPTSGRAALVARLPAASTAMDGRAVMVTAHMDVVGVEPLQWSVDPFSGEIRDGVLYGRGAIDDKGMLAVNLMATLLAKREIIDRGGALIRDLLFVATSDEEAGGDWGMQWLIDNHPTLIRSEFALNEGGRIRIVDGKPLYAAVQNAEKVSNVVTVIAKGPAGHASVPLEGNAVARLARAIARIAAYREPTILSPTTREFFARLGAIWPTADIARAMIDVSSGDDARIAVGAARLANEPLFDAVLRNGISPTMLAGGVRHNVIPAEAQATLSVRTLPGNSIDDVVARLVEIVDDPLVELTIMERGLDGPPSDFFSPMFEAIKASIAHVDSTIVTVPYMSTGATESARLRHWGVQTYGLLPFPLDEVDESRMHGADERVPLSALDFGTRVVYGVVTRLCAT